MSGLDPLLPERSAGLVMMKVIIRGSPGGNVVAPFESRYAFQLLHELPTR